MTRLSIFLLFLFICLVLLFSCDSSTIEKENYAPLTESPKNDNHKYDSRPRNYDSNNYDVVYHDTPYDINGQGGIYPAYESYYNVIDADGKVTAIPFYGMNNPTLPIYNVPGSFVYGSDTYVPSYEDSVYLSKTTGKSQLRELDDTTPDIAAGFCEKYKYSKIELEKKCSMLSKEQCSSTACCVLLGGTKCVAGDDKGPYRKANYTDISIKNTDYYYYRGKCYGNCNYGGEVNVSPGQLANAHRKHEHRNGLTGWGNYSSPNEKTWKDEEENQTRKIEEEQKQQLAEDYVLISPNDASSEDLINPYKNYKGWNFSSLLDADKPIHTPAANDISGNTSASGGNPNPKTGY
jgi:hypothetical protein